MISISKHSREVFYGGTLIVLLFFILLGYIYPATENDIEAGRTIPFNNDYGKYTNWFSYLFFTLSIFVLGYSLYSTFLKMDMTEWNLFAFGTFLMFVHGLLGVFQGIFNHYLFSLLKDLVLPAGLFCMLYSTYKIYEPFEEE